MQLLPQNLQMPPQGAMGSPPPTSTSGSLAAALGLNPQGGGMQPSGAANPQFRSFMGGLGTGMARVGAMRPGTNAGQAFATGMGGGIQGSDAADKEFFNETIAADNQTLKNKQFPYNLAELAARTNLYNTQNANGGAKNNPWQMSDVGRMHTATQEANEWYGRALQTLKMKKDAGVDTTDEANSLEDRYGKVLQQKYKQYGVDPNSAKGTEKNPIDASKISEEQLETMPEGTYFSYQDKDGKTQVTTRSYANAPNRYAQQSQQPQSQGYNPVLQSALNAPGQQ